MFKIYKKCLLLAVDPANNNNYSHKRQICSNHLKLKIALDIKIDYECTEFSGVKCKKQACSFDTKKSLINLFK